MEKKRSVLLIAIILNFYFSSSTFAETIQLKSGQKIEGRIIERTNKYIKIDFQGVPITYFYEDILHIYEDEVKRPQNISIVTPYYSGKESQGSNQPQNTPIITPYYSEKKSQDSIAAGSQVSADFYNQTEEPVVEFVKEVNELARVLQNEAGSLSEYSKAIEGDPNNAENYLKRGNVYLLRNEADKALSDFSKAIELNPNLDERVYFSRGFLYDRKGRFDEAISDYTKAIEINPDNIYAYIKRGDAFLSKNSFDRAIADYTKALEINPNYPYFISIYPYRAKAYFGKKEYEKSWNDLHKLESLLGGKVDSISEVDKKFLEELRKASGREE